MMMRLFLSLYFFYSRIILLFLKRNSDDFELQTNSSHSYKQLQIHYFYALKYNCIYRLIIQIRMKVKVDDLRWKLMRAIKLESIDSN
jgi:hypothetical protein